MQCGKHGSVKSDLMSCQASRGSCHSAIAPFFLLLLGFLLLLFCSSPAGNDPLYSPVHKAKIKLASSMQRPLVRVDHLNSPEQCFPVRAILCRALGRV